MYGGMLPDTGGFLFNPLRVLYVLIALSIFGGAWMVQKIGKRDDQQDEPTGQ